MLTRHHLQKHGHFLTALTQADTTERVRRIVRVATHFQLRTLIVLLATVVLKKVPVPKEVASVFGTSRKKEDFKEIFFVLGKGAQSPAPSDPLEGRAE